MNRISKMRLQYVVPIGLFLAFFLDGSISYSFSPILYRSYSMVPYLSLLWLIFTLLFTDDTFRHLEIWSAVAGGLFDWYYTGIWGVFIFIFPLVVYLTKILYKYFTINFFSAFLIYLLDLIVLLGLSFFADKFVDRLSGIATLTDGNFLIYVLVPTLLLNLIIFVALFFPIQHLFNYCQQNR